MSSSVSFAAYMAEKISVSRWDQFMRLFVVFFLIPYVAAEKNVSAIFDHPAQAILFAIGASVLAVLVSATGYWKSRYGERFERVYIVFLALVILILLTIIARHEFEKHKRNVLMNSNSTSQALPSQSLANDQRPTTNDQRLIL